MHSQVRFFVALALVAFLLVPPALAQKPKHTLKGDEPQLYAMWFNPDGKKLLTYCGKETLLWQVATGKKLASFGKSRDTIVLDSLFLRLGKPSLFSPDSKWLVLPGAPATVFEVATGKKKFSLDKVGELALNFAFSPDSKSLASIVYKEDEEKSASPASLRFWDTVSGKESKNLARKLTGKAGVSQLVYSPDGKSLSLIVLGKPETVEGQDRTPVWCEILNARTGKERHRILIVSPKEKDADCGELAFSPDSALFTVAGKVYDAKTGKVKVVLARDKDAPGTLFGMRFSPDGKSVLGAVSSVALPTAPNAVWWDATTGKELLKKESVRLAISGDGKTLFVETKDDIEIWDVNSRKRRVTMKQPERGTIFSAALSPDGKVLALGMLDGVVHVYDVPAK